MASDIFLKVDGIQGEPTDVVFAFGKLIYEYIPQKPNGQPDTPVTLKWDVKANKEFQSPDRFGRRDNAV